MRDEARFDDIAEQLIRLGVPHFGRDQRRRAIEVRAVTSHCQATEQIGERPQAEMHCGLNADFGKKKGQS
jgi:hypothetical protein